MIFLWWSVISFTLTPLVNSVDVILLPALIFLKPELQKLYTWEPLVSTQTELHITWKPPHSLTLVHWNTICNQGQLQLQWSGETIWVEITKVFTKIQFYKIKCIQVHKVLYDTEHSLRPSGKVLERKYSLYHQNMMRLTSTVTHFLMDVSQGTSPKFSKGWCTRELTSSCNSCIS